MNKVCLTGRTTKDIELRYTNASVAVATFTLAVNRKFKNQDGDYESDFINCVAFKKTAEIIADYVDKGDMLGIEGHIQTRNYEDQNGTRRYVTEVIVDSFDFLQQKQKVNDKPAENKKEESTTVTNPYEEFGKQIEIVDDDLPF